MFIENADGPRHVGNHLSRYEGSDLVFIGSGIPHLNFDYGVRTDYRKVVIQMREDFLWDNFQKMPELADVARLFEQASIAFGKPGGDCWPVSWCRERVLPAVSRVYRTSTGFSGSSQARIRWRSGGSKCEIQQKKTCKVFETLQV